MSTVGTLVDLLTGEGPAVIRSIVSMIKRVFARRGLDKAAIIADFEAVAREGQSAFEAASTRLHERFSAEEITRTIALDPGTNGAGHE